MHSAFRVFRGLAQDCPLLTIAGSYLVALSLSFGLSPRPSVVFTTNLVSTSFRGFPEFEGLASDLFYKSIKD
jgi:hypothetical protein